MKIGAELCGVVLLLCLFFSFGHANVLKIGILEDLSGSYPPYNLYTLAAQYINYTNILPPGVELELVYNDTGTDEATAIICALDMAREYGVQGVVGESYSYLSADVQIILAHFQIPQISDYSTSASLSNKNLYPYFLRTISADQIQAKAVLSLIVKMRWKNVVFVYTSDDYGINGRDVFLAGASQIGITVYSIALPVGDTNFTKQALTANSTQIHVTILFSQINEGVAYMEAVTALGMQGPDYAYIFTDGVSDTLIKGITPITNIFDGTIGIRPHQGIGPLYENVTKFINTVWPDMVNNMTRDDYLASQIFYSFDCVWVFAVAAANLLKAGVPFSEIKGKTYLDAIRNISVLGTTGQIFFDENGDRVGYYDIYNFRNGTGKIAALYTPATDNFTIYAPLQFYGGSLAIPIDKPIDCGCVKGRCINGTCVCQVGWSGPQCDSFLVDSSSSKKLIISVVVPLVVVFALVAPLSYFIYQRKRRRLVADISENQRSIINREEITLHHLIGRGAMGDVFKGTMRGSEVAVKRLLVTHMNKKAMENYQLEASMMCGLRHPNIVLFMGASHDKKSGEMFLIMEFLGRGSLHDVLHNKVVPLTNQMQLHIAAQAAQGMNFLHKTQPPIIHRDLKSHSINITTFVDNIFTPIDILLDEKWNAKISDFGMTQTKQNSKASTEDQQMGTLFWTAPEVLQGQPHSEASDVYAFGIILWELFHREVPYGSRDPLSVALEVMGNSLRPTIYDSTPPDIAELIRWCWKQAPDERPTFSDVLLKLKAVGSSVPTHVESGHVDAPTNTVYLVVTAVENKNLLWNDIPNLMYSALEIHSSILRELLRKYSGYEAYYKDNSFMVAFSDVEDAANWCLDAQSKLLHATWPRKLIEHSGAREEYGPSGELLRAGLQVRMAMHVGKPRAVASMDAKTTYFGPEVDKVKQILFVARNGEILLSSEVAGRVEVVKKVLKNTPYVCPFRCASFDEILYQMVPNDLRARVDSTPTPGEPTLDFEDAPVDSPHAQFVIPIKDIEMGERLGRGSIGETFKASWKSDLPNSLSQIVAVKSFTSRYFNEDVEIKLMNSVAIMSKLRHNNVVQIFGACFDVGHVSLVMELVPRGSLRSILSDSSVHIDGHQKIHILRDIARGMSYLHKQDPKVSEFQDLKSSKLLVGNDWTVKVTGYGLEVVKDMLRTMTSVGACPWTAPEIWTNSPIHSPESVTSYSFGIIMWEILTRQVPFDKQHPIKLCEAIIRGNRPPIPSSCPSKYANLMKRCWDTSPIERPSFDAILKELAHMEL